MIAIIQIMAQVGCFVPANSAQLRMTDKIFSRIGFHDNIEQNASSFTIELREIEYIFNNLTPNSLVIIDELCRSTNPTEGEMICWKLCEKLLNYIGVSNENYFKLQDEDDEDGEPPNFTDPVPEVVKSSEVSNIFNIPDIPENKPSTSKASEENVPAPNQKLQGHNYRQKRKTLLMTGKANKIKDITRPYIFMTTHFTSLSKLCEKFNNMTL